MAHHKTLKSRDRNNQMDSLIDDNQRSENGATGPELKEQSNKSEINREESSSKDEPRGFEIAGFPWQMAYVFGVIGLLVLAMILKLIGVI